MEENLLNIDYPPIIQEFWNLLKTSILKRNNQQALPHVLLI